jgi:hypothetical protein
MRFGFCDPFPYPIGVDKYRLDKFYGDTARFVIYWPGVYSSSPYNFGWYDKVIGSLGFHGQSSIYCIAQRDNIPPIDKYLNVVNATANKYKSNPFVAALELWNEPNLNIFGGFPPELAADYFRQGYNVARATGWTKPILCPGPARVRDWEGWLNTYKNHGGVPNGAGMSIHPYPVKDQPTIDSVDGQIKTIKTLVPDRGLWVTEIGVSTEEVSEDQQAKKLVNLYKLLKSKPIIKSMTVFTMAETTNNDAWHNELGVCKANYWEAKKAWYRLKSIVT